MSIIYDALKKVEKTTRDPKVTIKQRPNNSKLKSYLFYGFVACLGFFLTGILFSLIGPNAGNTQWAKMSEKNVALYHPLPKDAPMFKARQGPKLQFVLNGIFFSDNEGYALINNQITKEGDVVAGASVKKIGMSEVELEYKGSTIKLSNQ
jgi:hypothetical protein